MKRLHVSHQAELPLARDVAYHYLNERSWYPSFIPGPQVVQVIDEVWSRWVLAGVPGRCDADLTDNVLHHYLAWRLDEPMANG